MKPDTPAATPAVPAGEQPKPASVCIATCGACEDAPAASEALAGAGTPVQRFRIPTMDCAGEESEIRRG